MENFKRKCILIAAIMAFAMIAAPVAAVVSQSPLTSADDTALSTNTTASTLYTHKVQKISTWALSDNSSSGGTNEYENERIRVTISGIQACAFSNPAQESSDVSYGSTLPSCSEDMYMTLAKSRTAGYWTLWGQGKGALAGSSYTVTIYDDDDNSILYVMSGTISDPSAYPNAVQTQQGESISETAAAGAGPLGVYMGLFFAIIVIGTAVIVVKKAMK